LVFSKNFGVKKDVDFIYGCSYIGDLPSDRGGTLPEYFRVIPKSIKSPLVFADFY
jgi:hypothetical protein